jgi:hypothetical protein
MSRTKTLGAYLVVAGILQTCLYLVMSMPGDHLWLTYFDPRLAIFFLEIGLRGPELVTPWIFSWLSAVWIIAIGLLMLFNRPWVKTYIISEIVLSLPNMVLFVGIIWANLNAAHGFSIGELFLPVLIMIPFTLVPLTLAFRSRRKAAGIASDSAARAITIRCR